MDRVAAGSEELFRAQDFGDAPLIYEMLEVLPAPTGRPEVAHTLRMSSIDLHQGAQAFPAIHKQNATQPPLTLVKVEFDQKVVSRFHTTADDFINLSRAFHIHPYALYLISMDVVSFQQIQQSSTRATDEDHTCRPTYFVNYEALKIVWSYHPETKSSAGIILPRASQTGEAAYSQFCTKLRAFCSEDMMTQHPLFPLFIAISAATEFFDQRVVSQERSISKTEERLPFSPWSLDTPLNIMDARDVQKITWYSRKMAAAVFEAEDVLRHINMVTKMRDAFEQVDALAPGHQSIMDCLDLMLAHLSYSKSYAAFLRERAKNLLGVIFSLITRGDTLATIELARATKADGFSMKVIAIMTMAFLPGTAIATLLSLPLLNWDASPVVSQSFWIFWAISIPVTLAIFFIWWASIYGWSNMLKRLRDSRLSEPQVDDMELMSDWGDERASYTRRSRCEEV